jgi:endonuclease YncB( thermonuclease family)
MKYKPSIPILLIALLIPSIVFAQQYRVVKVSDGDSITVIDDGRRHRVRMVGIDAPERGYKNRPAQPFSNKSKKYLAELTLNKMVEIKSYGLDRYDRILGLIFVDGININLRMVEAGLAEVYQGRKPKSFDTYLFERAEYLAKRDKRNIWTLGDNYISPRQWRKMYR